MILCVIFPANLKVCEQDKHHYFQKDIVSLGRSITSYLLGFYQACRLEMETPKTVSKLVGFTTSKILNWNTGAFKKISIGKHAHFALFP